MVRLIAAKCKENEKNATSKVLNSHKCSSRIAYDLGKRKKNLGNLCNFMTSIKYIFTDPLRLRDDLNGRKNTIIRNKKE